MAGLRTEYENRIIEYARENSLKYYVEDTDYSVIRPYYLQKPNGKQNEETWSYYVNFWLKLVRSNYGATMDLLLSRSKDGDRYASSALGMMYILGWEVGADFAKGKYFMDLSIKQGSGYSAYELACVFADESNYFTLHNDEEREKYLKTALSLECEEAIEFKRKQEELEQKNRQEALKGKAKRSMIDLSTDIRGIRFLVPALGQEYAEAIPVSDIAFVSTGELISVLEKACREHGIQVFFSEAYLSIGGLANAIYAKFMMGDSSKGGGLLRVDNFRAILASHPNPPQQYCDELIVLVDGGVRFYFVGGSKSFKEMNDYEALKGGNSDKVGVLSKIKYFAGVQPDEEKYNSEIAWHEAIYSVFCDVI